MRIFLALILACYSFARLLPAQSLHLCLDNGLAHLCADACSEEPEPAENRSTEHQDQAHQCGDQVPAMAAAVQVDLALRVSEPADPQKAAGFVKDLRSKTFFRPPCSLS